LDKKDETDVQETKNRKDCYVFYFNPVFSFFDNLFWNKDILA